MNAADAEAWVRRHLDAVAEAHFPDNPGLDWRLHQARERDGLLYAEVEPSRDEVGYPRFQFVFAFAGADAPDHVATYCLEDGVYTLLSTSRGAPRLPAVLDGD